MIKKLIIEQSMIKGMKHFLSTFDKDRTVGSITDKEIKKYVKEQISKLDGLNGIL